MKTFEIGKEYNTIKKDMTVGARTFIIEKISRKNHVVMVSGGINGIYPLMVDEVKKCEYISLGMNHKDYCNPFASDIISR